MRVGCAAAFFVRRLPTQHLLRTFVTPPRISRRGEDSEDPLTRDIRGSRSLRAVVSLLQDHGLLPVQGGASTSSSASLASTPDRDSYHLVALHTLVYRKNFGGAVDLLSQIPRPSAACVHLVFSSLHRTKRFEELVRLADQLRGHELALIPEQSYSLIMVAWTKLGQWDKALGVLDDMQVCAAGMISSHVFAHSRVDSR